MWVLVDVHVRVFAYLFVFVCICVYLYLNVWRDHVGSSSSSNVAQTSHTHTGQRSFPESVAVHHCIGGEGEQYAETSLN